MKRNKKQLLNNAMVDVLVRISHTELHKREPLRQIYNNLYRRYNNA